jgi:hypothetical protein
VTLATVIVSLGYGLRRIKSPSAQAGISGQKIREISQSIDDALRSWPASSRALSCPPHYFDKKMPITHVKI